MTESPGSWTVGRLALALGIGSFLAVAATLGDPGITIDEPLDVRPGRTYVATLRAKGLGFFDRSTVARVFADNAEHPPLGRWLLGLASTLGEPFEGLFGGTDPYNVHAGRLAPAAAFAVLVGVVTLVSGRRFGRAAGVAAGGSLVLMPRVFAHAHLGALDTFITLFWTSALLAAARAVQAKRPVVAMAVAGLVWGLALLTKIHAWLLPPIVLVWALARLRRGKAVAAASAWAVSGLTVFVAGWPWLWYDTWPRLKAYLGTGVERLTIHAQYFGRVFADRDVPWHYPWVYFAVTVPIGLQALGLVGAVRAWRDRRADPFLMLPIGAIVMFLTIFSTNVPVYDGERLFLTTFPLWAILIGSGFGGLWRSARPRIRVGLVIFMLMQGYGVVSMHPFGLSYYNALVGGLAGAERLGLETTYWGDSVDRVLLDELARRVEPGQTVALVPTLHHIQAAASTTPDLFAKGIVLRDESAAAQADWLVVYRRSAYIKPEVHPLIRTPPVAIRSRRGVWLSGLWRRVGSHERK